MKWQECYWCWIGIWTTISLQRSVSFKWLFANHATAHMFHHPVYFFSMDLKVLAEERINYVNLFWRARLTIELNCVLQMYTLSPF